MNAQNPSPEPILRGATGFMAARLLGAAVELGVFEKLGNASRSQKELAERVGVPARRFGTVLNAMVSMGLIEREGGSYRCTPVAKAHLTEQAQIDPRPFVHFMNQMRYSSWLRLEEVLRFGTDAVEEQSLSPGEQALVSEGIAAVTQPAAQALAEQYDVSSHAHVLDIGGGTGSFLVALLTLYAQLRATLVDRAEITAVAREHLTGAGLSERVSLQAGGVFSCQLPADADVILLANVVHIFSPQHNGELLRRLRAQAARGTRLLLVDFRTDDSGAEPPFAAIMAGEFLLASGEGAVYSVSEIRG